MNRHEAVAQKVSELEAKLHDMTGRVGSLESALRGTQQTLAALLRPFPMHEPVRRKRHAARTHVERVEA